MDSKRNDGWNQNKLLILKWINDTTIKLGMESEHNDKFSNGFIMQRRIQE